LQEIARFSIGSHLRLQNTPCTGGGQGLQNGVFVAVPVQGRDIPLVSELWTVQHLMDYEHPNCFFQLETLKVLP
jgi:hypothetical protein